MRWPAAHPGPWRYEPDEVACFTDEPILDANGEPVVITDSGVYPPGPETARFIVDAVNERDRLIEDIESWRRGYIKARTERNACLLERDRLRDIVRKTLHAIDALYTVAAPGAIVKELTPDRTCLGIPIGRIVAEARAALGEGVRA